jgi:hypothetical protein
VTIDSHYAADIPVTLVATATEFSNGDVATNASEMVLSVTAVADAPQLSVFDTMPLGTEDRWLNISVTDVGLVDTDGSESLVFELHTRDDNLDLVMVDGVLIEANAGGLGFDWETSYSYSFGYGALGRRLGAGPSVAESSHDVVELHRMPEFLLPLDTGIRRRALLSSGQCSDGFVADCSGNGQCCDSDWVGDGSADCGQTSMGCDLSCYANDGGDCLAIDSSEDGSMTRSLQDVQSYSYSFSYDSTFGDADLGFGGLVAAHRVYTIPLAAGASSVEVQVRALKHFAGYVSCRLVATSTEVSNNDQAKTAADIIGFFDAITDSPYLQVCLVCCLP